MKHPRLAAAVVLVISFLLGFWASGCTIPVYVNAAGPCPAWSDDAIDEWDRLANDPATDTSVVEAVGRWIVYCESVDAGLER